MKAKYLGFLRLLEIEPCDLPFTFSNAKPHIDDGLYELADSLTTMEELLHEILPKLKGSINLQPAIDSIDRFLQGLRKTVQEYAEKQKEVENYKKRKRGDR